MDFNYFLVACVLDQTKADYVFESDPGHTSTKAEISLVE